MCRTRNWLRNDTLTIETEVVRAAWLKVRGRPGPGNEMARRPVEDAACGCPARIAFLGRLRTVSLDAHEPICLCRRVGGADQFNIQVAKG